MKIILNGKEKSVAQDTVLKNIVTECCRDPQHVITELNGQLIKRPIWEQTTLKEGDTLELVNFVGGG